MTYEIISHHGAPAVLVDIDTPGVKAAVRAIEASFGNKPVFIREGGSIPVVGLIKNHLGVDTLLLGWGQNDDNLHGPNEKFSLADFHRGIKSSAHLLDELAKESVLEMPAQHNPLAPTNLVNQSWPACPNCLRAVSVKPSCFPS